MIEWPLEAASGNVSSAGARYRETSNESAFAPVARETSPNYGDPTHDSRESWVRFQARRRAPTVLVALESQSHAEAE